MKNRIVPLLGGMFSGFTDTPQPIKRHSVRTMQRLKMKENVFAYSWRNHATALRFERVEVTTMKISPGETTINEK